MKVLLGISLLGSIAGNAVLLYLVADVCAKLDHLQIQYNQILERSEQVATKLKSISTELEESKRALAASQLAKSKLKVLLKSVQDENENLRKEVTVYADRASRSFK